MARCPTPRCYSDATSWYDEHHRHPETSTMPDPNKGPSVLLRLFVALVGLALVMGFLIRWIDRATECAL